MNERKTSIPFMDDVAWIDLVEKTSSPNDIPFDSSEEGELAVDVYENDKEVIVIALVAGVEPTDLALTVRDDLVTIRGKRECPIARDVLTRHAETFWGAFSRTIVLPAEVQGSSAKAALIRGTLTITMKKSKPKRITITDKDT